jgi:ParB family chromosome partitioning protein
MTAKNALGKGLGAMFPELLEGFNNRPSFVMCGIEELTPNRFQARRDFNDAQQQQLVSSIQKSGIIQPIIVRKSKVGYEIIAGERRWRAAQKAGLQKVPVMIRDAEDMDTALLSLIENIHRADLNPIEEAQAYQLLNDRFGCSQEEIAVRTGKDRSTVANTLRLLKLPPAIREALIAKKITSGHARSLLSINSAEEQLKILEKINRKALSVRDTERLMKTLKKVSNEPKPLAQDQDLVDLEKTLTKMLLTRVKVRLNHNKAGRIEIHFLSIDDLSRLIHVLSEKRR